MGDRIIAYAGKLLIHAVRALLVCWQRMLRLGLSVGILSGLIALVIGAYVTRAVPPAPMTWVVALIFGFALGYAAAMTVLADEMLLSIFDAILLLEGDVRAGLRAAAIAAEREAGETGRGIMRFLGHPRKTTRETAAPAPNRAAPSHPLITLSSIEHDEPGQDQANETRAAIAATEKFITTAPRPAVNARPVRADQLPRIGWASDEALAPRAPEAMVAAMPALAEMPPLPIRTLRSQPRGESSALDPHREPEVQNGDTLPAPPIQTSAATWPTPGPTGDDGPTELTEVSGDASTQPAYAADTVAAQVVEPAKEERGIWARIGQALIGNTTVPLREADPAGNRDGGQSGADRS